MDRRTFYVYEHWRADRDECFYVGKGRGIRATNMSRRNQHHKAIQAKLKRQGMAVEVRMVAAGLSQDDAFRIEVERILFWKSMNVDLANKSDGGDGNRGYKHTDEAKRKISQNSLSKNIRPPCKSGEENPFFGKKHSQETKMLLSELAKNRVVSEETRKKLSAIRKAAGIRPPSPLGRVWTDAQKKAHSERLKLAKMKKKEMI
jgi:hypothetical protein